MHQKQLSQFRKKVIGKLDRFKVSFTKIRNSHSKTIIPIDTIIQFNGLANHFDKCWFILKERHLLRSLTQNFYFDATSLNRNKQGLSQTKIVGYAASKREGESFC